MSRVKMDLAYAILMSQCTEGTFLYTPASAEKFRPGACGYFDDSGIWEDIIDLRDYEQLARKHYRLPQDDLGTMLQAPTSSKWDPLSVERDEEKGFKVNTELSGVAAQAPVDLGFDAGRKRTSDAGASLTSLSPVEHRKFNSDAEAVVMKWVEDNRKNLVAQHGSQIEKFGVWVITQTWVTGKCEISMWNKTGKSIDAGAEIGATNIAKFKADASSSISAGVDQEKLWDKVSTSFFPDDLEHQSGTNISRSLEVTPSPSKVSGSGRLGMFSARYDGNHSIWSSDQSYFQNHLTLTGNTGAGEQSSKRWLPSE